MARTLYNPFLDFKFDDEHCFLTGEPLKSTDERITVFPEWILDTFDLREKPFKMLDENQSSYGRLQLPCSQKAAKAIHELEARVAQAMKSGYLELNKLDQITLFQWVAKILYGVIFNEIQVGIKQAFLTGEEINFSQALVQKFKNLHIMLQSIVLPMEFEHKNPFSIQIYNVDNADDTFLYRDEINTLIFSLRMHDFGLIATLQDNGTNVIYHEDAVRLCENKLLHPIQFEELDARFFYTAYLFNRLPEYTYMQVGEKTFVEPMPLNDWTMKPIFDNWQAKTYGQVLENFWKPWGFTLFEIIKDPENPMSFISNDKGEIISREDIELEK